MFYHSCQIYTVQSIIFVVRGKHKTGGDLAAFESQAQIYYNMQFISFS